MEKDFIKRDRLPSGRKRFRAGDEMTVVLNIWWWCEISISARLFDALKYFYNMTLSVNDNCWHFNTNVQSVS